MFAYAEMPQTWRRQAHGALVVVKKNVLRLPRMSHLKTRMRQLVWWEAVQDVVERSHEKPVIRRLEKLLAHEIGQFEYDTRLGTWE